MKKPNNESIDKCSIILFEKSNTSKLCIGIIDNINDNIVAVVEHYSHCIYMIRIEYIYMMISIDDFKCYIPHGSAPKKVKKGEKVLAYNNDGYSNGILIKRNRTKIDIKLDSNKIITVPKIIKYFDIVLPGIIRRVCATTTFAYKMKYAPQLRAGMFFVCFACVRFEIYNL